MAKVNPHIAQEVETLLSRGRHRTTYFLKQFGPKAIPAVIAALRDPGAQASTQDPDPNPLPYLCEILKPHTNPEIVALLAPQAHLLRRDSLRAVIGILVGANTPAAWDAIARAATSPDPDLKSQTLEYLWPAFRDNAARDCPGARATFDVVAAQARSATGFDLEKSAEVLLALDAVRGTEFLRSLPAFHPDSRDLSPILRAIYKRHLVPDPPRIDELLNWANALPADRPEGPSSFLQYAIPLIARARPAAAVPLIEQYRLSEDAAGWGAAEAHAVIHGVEDAMNFVYSRASARDKDGRPVDRFRELTHPQQVYLACFEVDAQVCNGGFDQFFSNPSGRHATATPAALAEIGAPARADLVRHALYLLGPELLKTITETYVDLSPIPGMPEKLLDLTNAYYDLRGEPVLNLLKFYSAKHKTHFVPPTLSQQRPKIL